MDVETLRALQQPQGAALLAEAVRSYDQQDVIALGARLRRHHPPDLVAAALTQARLRHAAAAKLDPADAARMFFTADGLEQATRASVATHRAARVASALGPAPVADLCCGIGGDLVALSRAGLQVTGVEADPLVAAVARANVQALGLKARVVEADAGWFDRSGFAAVTCDPARRTVRGRVFDPGAYQPPWSFVVELLGETACVKVAPGIPHQLVPGGVEAEWISDRGAVKEAALWSGGLARDDVRRRATLLPGGHTITDADAPLEAPLGTPGRWLVEPDRAVIRAGLVTAVAAEVEGRLVDPRIAYVTADHEPHTPLGRTYEVVDVLPYEPRRLRAYVRQRRAGTVVVKKRGVDVDPEGLRRSLRPRGDAAVTLAVTRVAGVATVLVLDPVR